MWKYITKCDAYHYDIAFANKIAKRSFQAHCSIMICISNYIQDSLELTDIYGKYNIYNYMSI